ncbi:MAG: hypothetical protein OXS28_01340 [Gammaproteobacteria bacterium]|nr:hypothetical protein [Gammaproteobacteria bacterium]MDE0283189.1 hypothetical protein [Gammaproteobacteria bacterium]
MTAANEALSTETPAAVTFDTLSAAQALRKSGFEDRQAEAIVTTISKAMNETVATKSDLELQGSAIRTDLERQGAEIRTDLERQGAEIRTDLERQGAEIRKDLDKQIAATRKDLEAQGAATRAEIVATRTDLEKQIAATRTDLEKQLAAIRKDMELQASKTSGAIEKLEQSMASLHDKNVIRLGGLVLSMAFLFLAVGPFYFRWVMSLMAS